MRKSLLVFMMCLAATVAAFAQAPEGIAYQGVARDGSGNGLVNQNIKLKLSILQGSAVGAAVYEETHASTTNNSGLFSVVLGQGTVESGTFNTISWGSFGHWVKTEMDITGGTNYVLIGTTQLLSVSYALHAKTSDNNIPGPTGPAGANGVDGANGIDGATGPQGATGATGGYPVHFIGESYGGGIVFFVYDGGQHGLIAATADQSTGIRWYGGSNTNTRARAEGVGAGLKNTAIIIANQGSVDGNTFAATVCNEYFVTVDGVTYGDWYLPSRAELYLMYTNRIAIGGFTSNYYWSSQESYDNRAIRVTFSGGYGGDTWKDAICNVRAIRAF